MVGITADIMRGESKVAVEYLPLVPWLKNANSLGTAIGQGVAGSGFGLYREDDGAIRIVQENVLLLLEHIVYADLLAELGMTSEEFQAALAKLPTVDADE